MKRYFALVKNGIVRNVVVSKESPGEGWIETWKDGSQRGNYAGSGMIYDSELDAFYAPQPYPSWTLDDSFRWQPPIPYPTEPAVNQEGFSVLYVWDEDAGDWMQVVEG